MSLVLCPECGAKISDRAVSCPHCGYQSVDPLRPISEQDRFEIVPIFQYDIEDWSPNRGDLSTISYEDNKQLVSHFGNWETIQLQLPAIASVIKSLAEKDHIMAAKMPAYVKKLIDEGVYRFAIDKEGEILPTIRDAKGFVKNVRLQEMEFSPTLTQSLNNLSAHAAMARILDEIEQVGDSLQELRIELQNDRLAMAESARDKLFQARKIQDSKLREMAMLEVVHSATDAKRTLMRNFAQNLRYIKENSDKSGMALFFDPKRSKEISKKSIDNFQSLVFITNAVQTECEGYASLGEYESGTECLEEFRRFIIDNKLDNRDTLLLLNESSGQEQPVVIDEFSRIANNITTFEAARFLGVGGMKQLFLNSAEMEEHENETAEDSGSEQ